MAYTGRSPDTVDLNNVVEVGGPLENHDEVTVDASGNLTAPSVNGVVEVTTDPTITTNPPRGLGTTYINSTTGAIWVLFDDTNNGNKWKNNADGTIIQPNLPPGNPANTGSFPTSGNEGSSFNFTFSGATDTDGTVTHYLVDNFSHGNLSVTTAEVASGSPHAFSCGLVSGNVALTFRVRAKDNFGSYSSGVTVSFTVVDAQYLAATGGTITTSGDYKIHKFTSSGTFTITNAGNAAGSNTCQTLVIAGGGSGGGNTGGGGGAGDMVEHSSLTIPSGSNTITVGGGGAGVVNGNGGIGNNSSIGSVVTAIGGGGGGNSFNHGSSGGSGGAAGGGNGSNRSGGSATGNGFGNAGGNTGGTHSTGGSGGGGAGAAGVDMSRCQGHNGAVGRANSITGSSVTYAGGGGGGGKDNCGCSRGTGGSGGGGHGGNGCGQSGGNGSANTGGGAGGGAEQGSTKGGTGGSGVVIIKYKFQN